MAGFAPSQSDKPSGRSKLLTRQMTHSARLRATSFSPFAEGPRPERARSLDAQLNANARGSGRLAKMAAYWRDQHLSPVVDFCREACPSLRRFCACEPVGSGTEEPGGLQSIYSHGHEFLNKEAGIDRPIWHRLVIHPSNFPKMVFDVALLVGVLYMAITLPMKVSFGVEFLSPIDRIVDVGFVLDVILKFFHGYYEMGYPVLNPRRIALRYVRSGWFALDVFACVPFEGLFGSKVALLGMSKAARLARVRRLMGRSKRLSSSNLVRVVLTLLTWMLVAHWAACFFYGLGFYSVCNFEWYETCWVLVYPPWEGRVAKVDFCADAYPPGSIPASTRYVRALYWALGTMSSLGYGKSPVAETDAEFVWAILCQITGACMYAAIFGNIAQLIAKLAGAASRYQTQLDKVNEFIRFHHLPSTLCDKLHAYNNFLFAVSRGFDVNTIANALPPTLQREVYLHLYEHLVRRVPMFENCDQGFIEELVQLLKPQVLLKGDCVFRAFETGHTMYFIQNGAVQILDAAERRVYSTLIEGAYFGELSMLTAQRRTATARALTDCILFYVTIADFEEVVKNYPTHFAEILDKAIRRLEGTLMKNKAWKVLGETVEDDTEAAETVLQAARVRKASFIRSSIAHTTGAAAGPGTPPTVQTRGWTNLRDSVSASEKRRGSACCGVECMSEAAGANAAAAAAATAAAQAAKAKADAAAAEAAAADGASGGAPAPSEADAPPLKAAEDGEAGRERAPTLDELLAPDEPAETLDEKLARGGGPRRGSVEPPAEPAAGSSPASAGTSPTQRRGSAVPRGSRAAPQPRKNSLLNSLVPAALRGTVTYGPNYPPGCNAGRPADANRTDPDWLAHSTSEALKDRDLTIEAGSAAPKYSDMARKRVSQSAYDGPLAAGLRLSSGPAAPMGGAAATPAAGARPRTLTAGDAMRPRTLTGDASEMAMARAIPTNQLLLQLASTLERVSQQVALVEQAQTAMAVRMDGLGAPPAGGVAGADAAQSEAERV